MSAETKFQTTFALNDQMSGPLKGVIKLVKETSEAMQVLANNLKAVGGGNFDELDSSLNSVQKSLKNVETSTTGVKSSVNSINSNTVTKLSKDLNNTGNSFDNVIKGASGAKSSVESIHSTAVSAISSEANKASNSLNGLSKYASSTKSSIDTLNNTNFNNLESESVQAATSVKKITEASIQAKTSVGQVGDSANSKTSPALEKLKNLGSSVTTKFQGLGSTIKSDVNQNINQTSQATDFLKNKFGALTKAVASFLTVASAIKGIKAAINWSDEITSTNNRLGLVVNTFNQMTGQQETVDQLNDKIFKSAQNARTSYADMKDLVASLGNNAKNAFKNTEQMVGFAETLEKTFAISGASAEDTANATRQLMQALASGALRGDELNSVLEAAPELINTIADGMNVPREQIRAMAADGQLTTDAIVNAVMSQADKVDQRLGSMNMTFGQLWIQFQNKAGKAFESVGTELNTLANDKEFQQSLDDICDTIVELAPTVKDFVKEAAKAIPDGIKAVVDVLKWIKDNGQAVGAAISVITGAIIALKAALAVTSIIEGLGLTVATGPIGAIAAAIGALVGGIVWLWNNCEGFRNWVLGACDAIAKAWDSLCTDVAQGLSKAGADLQKDWDNICSSVSAGIDGIATWWDQTCTNFQTSMSNAGTGIQTWWNNVCTGASQDITTMQNNWNQACANLQTGMNNAGASIQAGWNNTCASISAGTASIQAWWDSTMSWMGQKVAEATTTVSDAWNGMLSWMGAKIEEIKTTCATKFEEIKTKFLEAGSGFLSSLIAGAQSKWEEVMNWFNTNFGWIPQKVKEIFGIASPSTVFSDIGANIVSGLLGGLQGAWEGVTSWCGNAFGGLIDKAKGIFGIASPSTVFNDIGNFIMGGLKQGIDGFLGPVMSTMTAIWDQMIAIFQQKQAQMVVNLQPQINATIQQMATLQQVMVSTFAATMAAIQAQIIGSFPAIQGAFQAELLALNQAAAAAFAGLIPLFASVLNSLKNQAVSLLGVLSQAAVSVIMSMASALNAGIQVMVQGLIAKIAVLRDQFLVLISQLRVGVITIFGQFVSEASEKTQELVNAMLIILSKLPADMYTIATQSMDAFAQGITDRTKKITDTTDALVQAVKAAFVKGLGIHSPAATTYYYGTMTGAGFINGLSDSQIAEFAKNTINDIIDAFVAGKFTADELVNFLDDDTLKVIDYIKADPELMAKSTISGGAGSASGIIGAAQKYIGYQSGDDYHSAFESRYGVNGAYWCAMFVKAMADEAGVPFPAMWGVGSVISWAKGEGRWSQTPAPGDAVTFGGGSHIGLVEQVLGPSDIITIEGNSLPDNGPGTWGVWRKHRTSGIDGYIKLGSAQAGAAVAAGAGMANTAQAAGIVQANGSVITYPLQGGPYTITSGFGGRDSPGGIGSTNHQGIDIGAAGGTPILSALPGIVSTAAYSGGYGNLVVVNHGNGLETYYGHMSAIKTAQGAQVTAGQLLGLVGSTGNSTGNHLHFGMMVNGEFIDPMPYLQGGAISGLGSFGLSLVDVLQQAYNRKKGINVGVSAYNPAGGAEQWRSTVTQALQLTGQPLSYVNDLLYAIEHESSGNPNAVYTGDVNAQYGGSKGLMQLIDPTFKAYALPGYNTNINDPLSNIIASIRYMLARYGSIENVMASRRGGWYGYSVGTRYVPHDMLAMIHEGEAILPAGMNPYSASGGNYLADLAESMFTSESSVSVSDAQRNTGATVISVGGVSTNVVIENANDVDADRLAQEITDKTINTLQDALENLSATRTVY